MLPLKQQLTEDMKNAMRAHDSLKLNTIRFLMSAMKNWEIDNGELDDAGFLMITAREVKKMKEAVLDFVKGGRQDLVDEENQKIAILEAYLPKQMSDEELLVAVHQVLDESETKEFGPLMKAVMVKVKGLADGNRVSATVKKVLAEG